MIWAVVAEKELKEIFRDFRTVLISLILPIVLFPILFLTLGDVDFVNSSNEDVYLVMSDGSEQVEALIAADNRLRQVPAGQVEVADVLMKGVADVYLQEISFDSQKDGGEGAERRFLIRYDNTDNQSISAARYISSLFQAMEQKNRTISGPVLQPIHDEEEATGRLFLSFVLPFLLFIFSTTCPLPIVGDLSAGEKERESLEPLLSTAAGRGSIVAGKIVAALSVGFLSVCAFSAGVYFSYLLRPEIVGGDVLNPKLPITALLLIFLFTFLLTSMYVAIELAVGIFTRSSREAQLWGMPILIVSMTAVYAASSFDMRALPSASIHIPLVNIALILRQLSLGRTLATQVVPVALWMIIYTLIAATAARYLFGREQAIFR